MLFRVSRRPKAVSLYCLSLLALLLSGAASAQVVISQSYGGGGNAGSVYTHDFVELFNRGNAAVDLTGWSVQYTSAGGNTWTVTNLTSVTLQPGQYYLVQHAQGAGGTTPLPTPDASNTTAMAGGSGKVALVNTTTALSGTCPAGAQIQDLLGMSGTANCSETAPSPAPSNTTAVIRANGGCTDSGDNSQDFVAALPTPRNTASPFNLCVAPPANPVATFGAAPSASEGNPPTANTLTFLVNVSPLPTAGNTVSFDVAVSGTPGRFNYAGPASILVEDDTVSPIEIEVETVPNAVEDGDASVTVTLSNFTGTDASQVDPLAIDGAILDDDLDFTPISEIQGGDELSPFDGMVVTTRGVVTGIRSNAFYIQTPQGEDDGDPLTSEGLYVYAGIPANMPPGLALGDLIFVEGTIDEFVPPADPNQLPVTEMVGPLTFTPAGSGNALPDAVVMAALDPAGAVNQLEHLEFMRVTVPSFTVTAPTEPSEADLFFGVVNGTPRPFREEGVDTLDCGDNLPAEADPLAVPCWDGNPELLRVKTNLLNGGAAFPLRTGAELQNLTGVLDYAFRRYSILTRSIEAPTILTANQANGSPAAVPLPTEVTIAGFNVENLAVSGSATYIRKADKVAQTVADYMHYPDIIGFIEVANPATLDDIAARISALANQPGNPAPDPLYIAEMEATAGTQRLGFLVKTAEVAVGTPRVEVLDIEERGAGLHVLCPDGISFTDGLLNDRAPLFMDVQVNAANGTSYPVMVINNHLKSLIDVDSNDPADASYACFNIPDPAGGEGRRNRAKRQQNAEYLTIQVDALQALSPDKPIVLVGDFNAFQFNDGYADLMNTILGTPPANDATVVPDDGADLVDPDLVNLTELVPDAERYSYVFDGNAQVLDHILANQAVIDTTTGFRRETPRVNADFTGADAGSNANAFRNSDHDPAVGYFNVNVFHTADLQIGGAVETNADVGDVITYAYELDNAGPDGAVNPTVTLTLPAGTGFVEGVFPGGWTCTPPAVGANGDVDCVTASFPSAANVEFSVDAEVLVAASGTTLEAALVATAASTDPALPNEASLDTIVAELNVAPVFAQDPYQFDVSAGAAVGTLVGTISATDANDDVLAYSLPAGAFSIDASGEIRVADPAPLIEGASFTLTAEVTDGNGGSDTTTVQIDVPEVNDAPVFDEAGYAFDVSAGAANGTLVGTVSATDGDAGDVLTYAILSGNPDNTFSIDAGGEIRVDDPAQLVEGASFTLSVEVTDGNGGSDTVTVQIDVPEVNAAPVFDEAAYAFEVNEGAASGTIVGSMSATDPDAGDVLTYSILSGNAGGAFDIDGSTGSITVANSAALTPGATIAFVVQVQDADGLTDTVDVDVLVIDLPDAIFADGFED